MAVVLVVRVVVVKVVVVAEDVADVVVAGMTATADPGESLTGMMALAGGEYCFAPLMLFKQSLLNLAHPISYIFTIICSYEVSKRGGGGRGNWGADDGRCVLSGPNRKQQQLSSSYCIQCLAT